MISVCCAVYQAHGPPNLRTLAQSLPAALGAQGGELCVALNGISAAAAEVPEDAVVVDLGVNRGVAPGWNAAARASRGDVLVFANDDCIPGPGSLAALQRALDHEGAGVVGPHGSLWDPARGQHLGDVEQPAEAGAVVPCDAVSGFLFACHRRTWEEVGGFDEAYAPASWEEIDFCYAVRATGRKCFVVGGVDADHEWGISEPQPLWRRVHWDGRSQLLWRVHRRNRRHFRSKWGRA